MKRVLAFIRNAVDVAKISAELEDAKSEIAFLKAEVGNIKRGPHHREVARDFDATRLFDRVAERVVEDFRPYVKRDAIRLLENGFSELRRRHGDRPMMIASLSEEVSTRTVRVTFQVERMRTELVVAQYE